MRGLTVAIVATMLIATSVPAVAAQPGAGVAAFLLAALATTQEASATAFEALSPAHQKIARALYEAQPSTVAIRSKLTLEQIAARRHSGQGWGEIFYTMKSHGLVRDKSVSQVVSNYERGAKREQASFKDQAAKDQAATTTTR